jgi:hypothetical protein
MICLNTTKFYFMDFPELHFRLISSHLQVFDKYIEEDINLICIFLSVLVENLHIFLNVIINEKKMKCYKNDIL